MSQYVYSFGGGRAAGKAGMNACPHCAGRGYTEGITCPGGRIVRSICDTCDEWHRVKIDGEWIDQGVYDFCAFIAEYDAACGGCLVTSSGGGG